MSDAKSIKVILLGESGVGKTNLINVALGKKFEHHSQSSVHSSFLEGLIDFNNKKYRYALWDTAGQEIYRALNKIFLKGSKVIIYVYSINNKNSFEQLEYWINNTKEILGDEKYIRAILANKSDLFEEQIVTDEQGKKLAEKYNIKFGVTSALVDAEGFKKFLKELIIDYIELIGEEEKDLNFQISNESNKKEKKKRWC